ncbi:alpha/beta hydrolase family protein [Candidatus Poriferisocius sp.]|uniref:alpha/beta hydrolase family protein n=1 Tax=Candidatus Poriferisocius sp. TaxID=3101276 RepID=UPI003B595A87
MVGEDLVPQKVEAILNPGRMLSDGIPYPDFEAARALDDLSAWLPFWADTAERYQSLGLAALDAGDRVSGGEWLWHSSLSWHYGQLMWFHEPERREHGQRKKVELYELAAPHLVVPAERVEVDFESTVIPGYLRIPDGPGPHPCAVLIGGLESTKEESYHFEALCHRRGVATLAFDGPGQGEMFFDVKLCGDFHRYTSAVLDCVSARPELDSDRIGVLGRSLGGYYAMQSAALDKRLKACVAWGGFFDMSDFDGMPAHTRAGFVYVSGLEDYQEGRAYLQDTFDLSRTIGELSCPTLLVQGFHDPIFPPHQTELLRAGLAGNPQAEIIFELDGDHCCHNMGPVVRPRMADYLARVLRE